MILQTDYTRRLWTGLSTDDWGQADLQEGDVIYLMDASECWVGGEGMMYQLPDLGGGGGSPTLTKLGSGDYTLTATTSYVAMPCSHAAGTVAYILYYKDTIDSGIAESISGIRMLDLPAIDSLSNVLASNGQFLFCHQRQANGTDKWNALQDSTNYSLVHYSGTRTAMTEVNMLRQSSSLVLQAGLYHWELWGYES